MDSLFGLLAVEQTLDVKVGAAGVLVNLRADPLAFAGDDDVRVHRFGNNTRVTRFYILSPASKQMSSRPYKSQRQKCSCSHKT